MNFSIETMKTLALLILSVVYGSILILRPDIIVAGFSTRHIDASTIVVRLYLTHPPQPYGQQYLNPTTNRIEYLHEGGIK